MDHNVAFITGINGQDGSYLAEMLLEKGYYVYGIIRRMSCINTVRIDGLYNHPRFKVFYGDMTDALALKRVIDGVCKEHTSVGGGEGERTGNGRFEVYNLAAQSHVKVSFEMPEYTIQVNSVGTLHILEILRNLQLPKGTVRFYNACTSEMYGDADYNTPMNENTPFNPVSPYAISKQMAFYLVKMYRSGYGMFACNGILFNHESPRRGENFVTKKVVMGAHEIVKGRREFVELGNLDSVRDWGHARDYVEGMWLMLQAEKPDDFVLGTGKTTTVREFVERVFAQYGIALVWEGSGTEEVGKDGTTGVVRVRVAERYMRPIEVPFLEADYSKACTKLGWRPRTSLDDLIRDMIEYQKNKEEQV